MFNYDAYSPISKRLVDYLNLSSGTLKNPAVDLKLILICQQTKNIAISICYKEN